MTDTKAALLFDLDGTLIDSAPDLAAAINRLMEEEARPALSEAQVRRMVGDGAAVLVRRAFEATGGLADETLLPALTARFLAIYEGGAVHRTTVFPKAAETLRLLKDQGHPLAIVTNKPFRPTRLILDAFGLSPLFSAVIGGDSVPGLKKPHPAPLFAAIEALRGDRARAVMIGDSGIDVAAGRAAGMPVIAVSFGYARVPPAELEADALIDGFAELPGALIGLELA